MSHTRLTTLAFLLLELSPFILFEKKFCFFSVIQIHFTIFRWYGKCPKISNNFILYFFGLKFAFYVVLS